MKERPPEPSAIGAGLLVLGDQWNLLILQQAFLNHIRRFADWRDALAMSESVLAARLKELVAAGLLEPAPYRTDGRTRTEYRLTEKARELWSFLIAIWSWERAWVPDATQPRLAHDGCGDDIGVRLACESCGAAPITARDTAVTSGPDTTFRNVAVPRYHRRAVRDRDRSNPDSYLPETMAILGDRWSTVVLVAAFLRVRRFADFQDALGVAPGILSNRLKRFVQRGVLVHSRGDTDRDEYRLTPKGLDFFAVFAFLVQWAQDWYDHPPDGGLRITHQECGRPLRAYLACTRCGDRLERRDVHFRTSRPVAVASY